MEPPKPPNLEFAASLDGTLLPIWFVDLEDRIRGRKLANAVGFTVSQKAIREAESTMPEEGRPFMKDVGLTLAQFAVAGLWTGLETSIFELMLAMLTAKEKLEGKNPVPRTVEAKMKGQMASAPKRTTTFMRLIRMMGANGISCPLSRQQQFELERLNAIRNLVFHKSGIVDEKFAQTVRQPELPRGSNLVITDVQYHHFFGVVGDFITAAVTSVGNHEVIKRAAREFYGAAPYDRLALEAYARKLANEMKARNRPETP